MALRLERGARRRRAPLGGAGLVALASALYLAAGAASTWPALKDARTSFLAEGRSGHGAAAPGDHLQSAYNLWLVGHQLERGAAPWRDPYSFQPVAEERTNFAGWPFGLVWWPLGRALGTVGAWNALVLLGYLAAGALTALWLRSLGLGTGASIAGGLVFALAPYRVAQASAGHLLAWVSLLLPLALWALERRRMWLAGAAVASIPLSGQVHLALGAIPFFLGYALLRTDERRVRVGAVAGAAAAVAAGLVVYLVSIRRSLGETRSFAQVERYSAELADLVARDVRHGLESFVLLGWLTPLLALAGLGALLAARRLRLAAALALGAIVPVVLALGANLPGYQPLWRHVPGLHSTRVPERLMPIACLCLAALAAFALDRLRSPAVAALGLVLLVLDLRAGVELYRPTAADEHNAAYAALGRAPPGRLLEVPVFLPDRHEGGVYLYYAMQAPRERPTGYSTVAPPHADAVARALRPINCGRWSPRLERLLRTLDVRYVVHHTDRYVAAGRRARSCFNPAGLALERHGFGILACADDFAVILLARGAGRESCPPRPP